MMKKAIILFALFLSAKGFSQLPTPKLYIGINSHNEMLNTGTDAEPYETNQAFYDKTVDSLIMIANMINSKGAKYNLQTCQRFVYATHLWDAAGSPTVTNDPLEYCYKLGGAPFGNVVEIDPRSKTAGSNSVSPITHTLNMADVAHMIDSTGALSSKTVGGFIYKPTTSTNWTGSDWLPYTFTITGTYNKPWKANILWGAGASILPLHTQDANNFGVWKPRGTVDSIDFYCHDPAQNVWVQGNGCAWNLAPTSGTVITQASVNTIIAEIRAEATKIVNGTYPANKFYCTSLMFNFKHLQIPGLRAKLTQIIDSINVMVGQGKIVWATINQKQTAFAAWSASTSIAYSQWRCGQTTTLAPTCNLSGMSEFDFDSGQLKIYPNPTSTSLTYEWQGQLNNQVFLNVYDNLGRQVISKPINYSLESISVSELNDGVYYLEIKEGDKRYRPQKLIISR